MRGILRFGALCASLAACGGGSGGGASPDAFPTFDGPLDTVPSDTATTDTMTGVDAPPDSGGGGVDAMPDSGTTTPVYYRWIVDNQVIPTTTQQAQLYGLDLDGNGSADNQLGFVFSALTAQGFDLQPVTDQAVARGQILMLGEANVATPAAATYTMYSGANPNPAPCTGPTDTVCRKHLAGTATFDLAATSAHDTPLAGSLANGVLTAGPGNLQVTLGFTGAPLVLNLVGARVRLDMVSGASFGASVIAGAITTAERLAKIDPALQQSTMAAVAADCTSTTPPTCGCAAGSTGATMLSLFDSNPKDCQISLQEISDNSLINALLAPDVVVGGQEAISFGFGATAVKATYTP